MARRSSSRRWAARWSCSISTPRTTLPAARAKPARFATSKSALAKLGVKVLGVSPDDVASHVKFRDKFKLNFPLLADPDHKVADKYGAWREKNMYGKKSMGIQRSTYLIDAAGNVAHVWKKVNVDGHDEDVIAAVKKLGSDGRRYGASSRRPGTLR